MQKTFKLGQVVMTRGISDKVSKDETFSKFVFDSLKRHAHCDWGDLCQEDKQENDYSLDRCLRLLSAYKHSAYKHNESKIWIITEADRSATTILFPEEY